MVASPTTGTRVAFAVVGGQSLEAAVSKSAAKAACLRHSSPAVRLGPVTWLRPLQPWQRAAEEAGIQKSPLPDAVAGVPVPRSAAARKSPAESAVAVHGRFPAAGQAQQKDTRNASLPRSSQEPKVRQLIQRHPGRLYSVSPAGLQLLCAHFRPF